MRISSHSDLATADTIKVKAVDSVVTYEGELGVVCGPDHKTAELLYMAMEFEYKLLSIDTKKSQCDAVEAAESFLSELKAKLRAK
jgi:hypothetical protein